MDSDSEDKNVSQEVHDIMSALMSGVDQMDKKATELFQSLMMLKELYSGAKRSEQELMAEEVGK